MALKKKATRKAEVTKKHSTAKNGFSAGTYTVPKGHVSIAVPAFWTLRQTNEDLEVEAPSGATSVIVTAFKRDKDFPSLDAREYLEHYLENAPRNGRLKVDRGTKQKAVATFRDTEGDSWKVVFLSNGNTLLLATCNTSLPAAHKEAKAGEKVLGSIRLKR